MLLESNILECHMTSISHKFPYRQMTGIELLGLQDESLQYGNRRKSGQ